MEAYTNDVGLRDETEEDHDDDISDHHNDISLLIENFIGEIVDSGDWTYQLLASTMEALIFLANGLSEEQILQNIEQETFESNAEETNTHDDQICTICQEDYVDGERIGRTNCKHMYHLDCIKQWLRQKNKCPICRQKALEINRNDGNGSGDNVA